MSENSATMIVGIMFFLGASGVTVYGFLLLVPFVNPAGFTIMAFGLLWVAFGLNMIKTSKVHREYNVRISEGPVIQLATFHGVNICPANAATPEVHYANNRFLRYVNEAYTGTPVLDAHLQDHGLNNDAMISRCYAHRASV